MNAKETRSYDEENRRLVERHVSGMSHHNRSLAATFLQDKHLEGQRTATAKHYAKLLADLDVFLDGRHLNQSTPEELRAFLVERSKRLNGRSLAQLAAYLKHFVRRHMPEEHLPFAYRKALRVSQKFRPPDLQPIDKAEFDRLLEAAGTLRDQALLWVLWDTGFRKSEALGLRVGSVEFDEKGGARLRLPADAPALKTGPRTVYVVESVPILGAWLHQHPSPDDREAALFPSIRYRRTGSLAACTITNWLRDVSTRAGTRRVWCHLFRHTRATRAARNNWSEQKMRQYFGWEPGSPMPSYYIHLADRDLENQVRRDAGIDEKGYRIANPALDEAAAEERLRKALRKRLLADDHG